MLLITLAVGVLLGALFGNYLLGFAAIALVAILVLVVLTVWTSLRGDHRTPPVERRRANEAHAHR